MADATKTAKPAADEPAPEAEPAPEPELNDAQRAELAHQAAVVEAVAKAHTDELPTFGGDLLEPGLGR